jgi:pectate lyase
VLFTEDFEDFANGAQRWSASAGSAWAVQTDPGRASNVYAQTETDSNQPQLTTAGDLAWRDVSLQADVQIVDFNGSSSSYMAGICLRVRDANDFYLIGIRSNDGKLGLRRYANGGTNLVQSTDFDSGTTGVWYTLRADVVGSTITAYLNGTQMFSTTDSTLASGNIGLCTVRASALFDNVTVRAP